jgi:hypothetical protein
MDKDVAAVEANKISVEDMEEGRKAQIQKLPIDQKRLTMFYNRILPTDRRWL